LGKGGKHKAQNGYQLYSTKMRHEVTWGGGAAGGAAAHRRKVSLGGKSSDAGNRCNTTNSETAPGGAQKNKGH